jgi:hydroxymethylpyrimidine pyrophosphatase-like HAD family hydrolase
MPHLFLPQTNNLFEPNSASFEYQDFQNLIDAYHKEQLTKRHLSVTSHESSPLFRAFVQSVRSEILYCTDFDGSLADKSQYPDSTAGIPEALQATIKLLGGGIINTSRDEKELLHMLGPLWVYFLDKVFVTELGGKVVSLQQDPTNPHKPLFRTLHASPLSIQELKTIADIATDAAMYQKSVLVKFNSTAPGGGQILWTSGKESKAFMKELFPVAEKIYSMQFDLLQLLFTHQPVRATIFGEVTMKSSLQYVKNFAGFEVNTKGVNKATGLEFVSSMLGKDSLDKMVVVGDDHPDASMLQIAKSGFIVGSRTLLADESHLIRQPTLQDLGTFLLDYYFHRYQQAVHPHLASIL